MKTTDQLGPQIGYSDFDPEVDDVGQSQLRTNKQNMIETSCKDSRYNLKPRKKRTRIETQRDDLEKTENFDEDNIGLSDEVAIKVEVKNPEDNEEFDFGDDDDDFKDAAQLCKADGTVATKAKNKTKVCL